MDAHASSHKPTGITTYLISLIFVFVLLLVLLLVLLSSNYQGKQGADVEASVDIYRNVVVSASLVSAPLPLLTALHSSGARR